ncbi:Pilin (bacterial filament) [Beggiatoa alba B18LD]|uniref:Pilin (Bacterial filament) n=1 Tax=Beggiatoa alba B18LD TaxID=395493 RepID=I3CER4_9GAMM|nr:pilin [Beggiatoa alba]EIJ42107.1 Pilin (bacterial filament) [Beggiatoa alba B18LD]
MKKVSFILLCIWLPFSYATTISDPPTLRTTLPTDTIAYIRVPNLWGFFSAPKGSVLNDAQSHEAHTQQILSLQQGVYANLIQPFINDKAVETLLTRVHSPIEAAFIYPAGSSKPDDFKLIITTQLTTTTPEEVNAVFNSLTSKAPDLKVVTPLSADGYGLMVINPFSVASYFDKTQKRLTLYIGTGVSVNTDALKKQLSQLQATPNHPMYALENQIDSSGQGLFYWTNTEALLPLLQNMLPPEELAMYKEWGLLSMRAFAFGWGVSNGKGRLGLLADIPKTGYLSYLPALHNEFPVNLTGRATLAATINLPLLEMWQNLEKYWQVTKNEEQLAELAEAEKVFKENIGLDLRTVLETFGGEIGIFMDDAGQFLALRIRNAENWQTVLKHLIDKYKLTYETRDIGGKTYHHLAVPNIVGWAWTKQLADEYPDSTDDMEKLLLSLFEKVNAHYYWVEENGFLILGEVPQSLIDREQNPKKITLQAWLTERHRLNVSGTLLSFSGSLNGTPRYIYYAYLQLINMMGDFSSTPVDLFALPNAYALNFPTEGTYALQIDMAESQIGLTMTFENSPLDLFFGLNDSAGFIGVAAIGILAAVAIPAYTDYLNRLEEAANTGTFEQDSESYSGDDDEESTATTSSPAIAEAIQLITPLKVAAEEGYFSQGKLPTIAEIGINTEGQYVANIELLENGSGYGIYFKEDSGITGALFLTYDTEGYFWKCEADEIDTSLLPEACQPATDAQ